MKVIPESSIVKLVNGRIGVERVEGLKMGDIVESSSTSLYGGSRRSGRYIVGRRTFAGSSIQYLTRIEQD